MDKRIKWPDGKDFAFTVFDDTDNLTLQNGPPVYDFLDSLGIRTTKTVWPLSGTIPPGQKKSPWGDTCADKDYLDWVLSLQKKGFEIALHNVRSDSSVRRDILLGLEKFKELFGHHPYSHANHTGCQDGIYWGNYRLSGIRRIIYTLATRGRTKDKFTGHIEASPFFWGDACKQKIRYVRNFITEDINTLKAYPSMPYHDSSKPYVQNWFSASNGHIPNKYIDLLSERNQDRLEAEGGLCIVYTHFGNKNYDQTGLISNGTLDSRFCKLMERLSKKNGWFVPVNRILDYILEKRGPYTLSDSERVSLEWKWLMEKIRTRRSNPTYGV